MRIAKMMGACIFMGMGAMAMGISYTVLVEKITGKPITQD